MNSSIKPSIQSAIKPSIQSAIKPSIRLRPHHLLCLQTFVGHGYSPDFTKHMTYVKSLLTADPNTAITLVAGPDDLCGHCPNCVDGSCTSPKPAVFDHLVGQKLHLKEEHVTEKSTLVHSIAASDSSTSAAASDSPISINGIPSSLRMSEQLLAECCPDCEWKELCVEVCRTTLR